jgi:predicted RNase H-like HicB family nuclease
MGGATKPPPRCCSKSHRICQIRPSTKPIAIATEISKTIKSHQVIGMFLPANLTGLPEQRLPDSFYVATLEMERAGEVASGTNLRAEAGNCYSINNIAAKPKRTVAKPVFWQHSAKVARLRKLEDDIHTARVSIMAEFRRYPLRVEQSKLDGWWFVFVDALPEVVVFGPNYEDLLGRLKRIARNVLRGRGETVTNIEITTVESSEAAMALWVIPGGKTGVMDAPLNVYNDCN